MSLSTVLPIMAGLGMREMIRREVAKGPRRADDLVWHVIVASAPRHDPGQTGRKTPHQRGFLIPKPISAARKSTLTPTAYSRMKVRAAATR
jgi:hypothetical protein